MQLYRVKVKENIMSKGIRLDKGMSVDIEASTNPLSIDDGITIIEAFFKCYAVDIRRANILSKEYLDITIIQ